MSGWEVAGYGLWFAALLGFIGFIAREFVTDGRKHQAANERIGDTHQPVLVQTQAWQQSCGTGTTVHPAPPSRTSQVGGSADPISGGRHTQAARGSTPTAIPGAVANGDLSDEQVRAAVRREFDAQITVSSGGPVGEPELAVGRVVGVAQVAVPTTWEDINRKRAEQDAWLADPDRTAWFPLVPARKGGAR